MTLKEADEVAQKRLPVTYEGITYKRITQIGYTYTDNGSKIPYIQLLDKGGNSVTNAIPAKCEVVHEGETE